MSPRSLNILLGEANQARAIFQAEQLNYFLVEMDEDLTDPLLCSALFSPEQIGAHLGTKWTDGTHFLLTWLGPGVEPLPPSWLEGFRKKISSSFCSSSTAGLRDLARQLGKNPRWGSDLRVP
jgi:hypothetical protein